MVNFPKCNPDNVPEYLKQNALFCLWKYGQDEKGRPTKHPYNPHNPRYMAKVSDSKTFAPFGTALAAAEKVGGFDGLGVGLFGGIVAGIDIDHCITDGKFSDMALDIIKTMDAYTEKSPSGEGVRILFQVNSAFVYDKAKYYTKRDAVGLEVYTAQRYLTVTGNAVLKREITDKTDALQLILDKYMVRPTQKSAQLPAPVVLTDAELIEKARNAKNGAEFVALYDRGDTSAYNNDDSSADLALCNMLAFWTNRDAGRMDLLFRQSALMRSKWTQRRGPDTYGNMTIQKAISACSVVYTQNRPAAAAADPGKPEPEQKKSRPRLTPPILSAEMGARGYSMRYNLITKEYEVVGRTESGRPMVHDDLITIMQNALADDYKGVTIDNITQYATYEAREREYNPVLQMLNSIEWDGIDRLPQLYALIGIENDTLSQTLVRKWLLQSVAMLFNTIDKPFGADGCLVFNGEQGAGKTSLFRHLAMKSAWFGEGMTVNDRDKDTTRRIVSVWIAELGEVESTLKSDISALKAFITNDVDHYRLPYGKADTVAPRLTSMCATCNSDRYLIDQTGNRRWWSVPFNRFVTRAELMALDAPQLWAQMFAQVKPMTHEQKAACFRLTDDERNALAERNGEFEKPLKSQPEVEDILAKASAKELPKKKMTVADFKELWPVLKPYSVQQIGIALKRCGIEPTRTKHGRFAELPVPYGKP